MNVPTAGYGMVSSNFTEMKNLSKTKTTFVFFMVERNLFTTRSPRVPVTAAVSYPE